MTKILVLSDTHIPERADDLPKKVYEDLASCDLALHAGDITSFDFFMKLKKKFPKLKAVQGNMDEPRLKNLLPARELITIDNVTIGLMHGWGSHQGVFSLMEKEFTKEKPQVVVFGHSHHALNITKNGILFLNPGSPTDKVFSLINSYGVITINGGIHAQIIKV
ncbi:MAG: hypothetical protein A2Y00_03910 [Omnitrophica WOR_2 bacterium GWF2_43_52]|nr:MAG: hypothetical protein A2Y01_07205 [Omnitrophica WOR_2 bacterium GWC2_44_8]OGX22578.1 MAG: hypothetical protein A2Y00_03910 [Omnitrophica WOR_2 bacterium GWF2_43_52]HAH21417.1 hypothetical protein [Candidatus Omnitrophota bacterium]HBG64667.1 hypothetical protein [Candidatus Omnitrophota bacterium]HCD39124.1 hypothetical protein [Candidatus Omnitrophota bacterium]